MLITFEVYKKDARTKEGRRLVDKYDSELYDNRDQAVEYAEHMMAEDPKLIIEVFVTMVEKKNIMNGEKFMERYDTPYFCSPSSETYWSM